MYRIIITAADAREAPTSVGRDQDGGIFEQHNGWQVNAVTAYGDVFIYLTTFADRDDAERLAARVNAAAAIDPVHWAFGRAAYGTQAWLDYGEANEQALEAEEALYPTPVYGI